MAFRRTLLSFCSVMVLANLEQGAILPENGAEKGSSLTLSDWMGERGSSIAPKTEEWIDMSGNSYVPTQELKAMRVHDICKGVPKGVQDGFIMSPMMFVLPYPNNKNCTATIVGPPGSRIVLEFRVFELEACSRGHIYDYVSVFSEDSPVKQLLCGDLNRFATFKITSIGSSVSIRLWTNSKITASGFNCLFRTVNYDDHPRNIVPAGATVPRAGSCTCGVPNISTINVSGQPTEKKEYPWQVSLLYNDGNKFSLLCEGSIIADTWILSTAHCTLGKNPSSIEILVKEHSRTQPGKFMVEVVHIINHPNYKSSPSDDYDFSLLRLRSALDFNYAGNSYAPICLPTNATNDNVEAKATITEWEDLSSEVLDWIKSTTAGSSTCP